MKVYLRTYGCQMNEYDSELIRSILEGAGYAFVEREEDADILLLNTCSVRENANRKVYGYIRSVRHNRNDKPLLIGLLGCMATNFRKALLEDHSLGLDFIAGPDSYKRLPNLIKQAQEGEKAFDVTLSEFETYADVYPTRKSGVNAWIAVMRGCNNFCTFCIVPYTRGRERSRAPGNILEEVRQLAKEGFKQITLLGQNVNSYRYENCDFAQLLQQVSAVEGIERIRFTSPHPKDFPKNLLDVMAQNPKVCKHIHLPLQAGSNRILSLMDRLYTKEEFLALVKKIRKLMPHIALTTDIIVGFPSETEKDFEETLKVMEDVRFDSAFIFKYSVRNGTIAQKKFKDDVSEEEKTRRIVLANDLQKKISLEKNQAHVGEKHQILIEEEGSRKSSDTFQGRMDNNKLVLIPKGPFHKGDFVNVIITEATPHVLKGNPA